jgi:hypothetical protein
MTAGHIYIVAGGHHSKKIGNGGPAIDAGLFGATSVAIDSAGNVLLTDQGDNYIRVIAESTAKFYGRMMQAGYIYALAGDLTAGYTGDGTPATQAELNQPTGVAVDSAGNVVIGDTGNNVVRLVAEHAGTYYGQSMTAGDIYTVAGNGTAGYSGDGGPATSAEFYQPGLVTVDSAGNLVIPDTGNNVIRVVAESNGTFYGQSMTAGDIYQVAGDTNAGIKGNGGPAKVAELDLPSGVTLDAAGNVVIADPNDSEIRVVAKKAGTFYGQAMKANYIYDVAGTGFGGFSGDGGPATSAQLDFPYATAVDAAGNLIIADSGNSRVRVVAQTNGTFFGVAMTAGNIYTIAGDGTTGFSGDGASALNAKIAGGGGLTVNAAGDLLFCDSGNNRIREVAG